MPCSCSRRSAKERANAIPPITGKRDLALRDRGHCKKRDGHCGDDRPEMAEKHADDDLVIHTIQPDGAAGMRLPLQLNRMRTCACTHAAAPTPLKDL